MLLLLLLLVLLLILLLFLLLRIPFECYAQDRGVIYAVENNASYQAVL